MRLIDADALLKKFCVNSEGRRIPEVDCDNHEITVSIKDIKKFIREQPTAYNVDKVLIELDKQTNLHNISEASDYWTWITAMEKAIDIVKRGGVE